LQGLNHTHARLARAGLAQGSLALQGRLGAPRCAGAAPFRTLVAIATKQAVGRRNVVRRGAAETLCTETSPRQILVMEWIHGYKVNDARALRRARISTRAVGVCLERAFAEMTFVHGHLHADPHPGNIMVRPAGGSICRLGRAFPAALVRVWLAGRQGGRAAEAPPRRGPGPRGAQCGGGFLGGGSCRRRLFTVHCHSLFLCGRPRATRAAHPPSP
jgi:hypothetical protein